MLESGDPLRPPPVPVSSPVVVTTVYPAASDPVGPPHTPTPSEGSPGVEFRCPTVSPSKTPRTDLNRTGVVVS